MVQFQYICHSFPPLLKCKYIVGSTLLKVGLCQQKLGALERDFATSATQAFVDPLKKFMDSDLKVS